MQPAERGLLRAKIAQQKIGLAAVAQIFTVLHLRSLDQIDNLNTLHELVVALETAQNKSANSG